MENEKARMERLFNKAAKLAKVTGWSTVQIPMSAFFWVFGQKANLATNHELKAIGYTPGFGDILTDDEVTGALLHELGHTSQDGEQTRANEFAADSFAAHMGYAKPLITGMAKVLKSGGYSPDDKDFSHPSLREREANVGVKYPQV